MPYRHTESTRRRLAAREQAILTAATGLASEGGMAAVQIAAVADRANVAAGTVYRYFPSKTDLLAKLVTVVGRGELVAVRESADAAPGPLSALAASITTLAARALANRRLIWAIIAEPVEAEVDALRIDFRQALAAELERRIKAAVTRQLLPDQDTRITAPAIVGALMNGLLGPTAPIISDTGARRETVQTMAVLALRALGIIDARARGLVAQCALP
jgi:AcrR family transcriptional regulator